MGIVIKRYLLQVATRLIIEESRSALGYSVYLFAAPGHRHSGRLKVVFLAISKKVLCSSLDWKSALWLPRLGDSNFCGVVEAVEGGGLWQED